MKKYVFFHHTLAGMGGAQMYVYNKVKFLQRNDWFVDVIFAVKGDVSISELKQFESWFPETEYPYYVCPLIRRNRIVNEIIQIIASKDYDNIVIESNGIVGGCWAEVVAERIGAKHISYLLQEKNVVLNKGMRDFFIFKHQRKELAGITDMSLLRMFQPFYNIKREESYELPAYIDNVVADIESPFSDELSSSDSDFVIGSLGRLEKPFVLPAVRDFVKYAKKHNNNSFLLIMIGGAPKDSLNVSEIKKIVLKETSNVKLIITGYLFPVPKRLLEACDAFFSSSGSAEICMSSGVPTIVYDGNDLKPIGILGRTTNSSLFRNKDEPVKDFNILMDNILIYKHYPKVESSFNESLPDFQIHLKFVHNSSKITEYFVVKSIRPELVREKIDYLCLLLFGIKVYSLIRSVMHKLLK